MSESTTPKPAREQISSAIRELAKRNGAIPTLSEIRDRTTSTQGGKLSNGSLYDEFRRYGDGGVADFAHAHGVTPAVIVDGNVHSPYLGPQELVDLGLASILPTAERVDAVLGAMSSRGLIDLLGSIAMILRQRDGEPEG